jgi:hypothetical protein
MITALECRPSDKPQDPHYRKMAVYREVPMWWYGAGEFAFST